MNIKRTSARRSRSAATSVRFYLSDVHDWARQANSPAADRLDMGAAALRAKLDDVVGPTAGLVEAMGGPSTPSSGEAQTADEYLDVLQRSHAGLVQLGEDCDPQTIGVGLTACGHIIKHLQRTTQGAMNLGLLATATLAPKHMTHDAPGEAE